LSEEEFQQLLIEWNDTECQWYYLEEKEEKLNTRVTLALPTTTIKTRILSPSLLLLSSPSYIPNNNNDCDNSSNNISDYYDVNDYRHPHQNVTDSTTVHEVFEEQVKRTSDVIAFVFEDEQITYR
jgi:hypothetical protein